MHCDLQVSRINQNASEVSSKMNSIGKYSERAIELAQYYRHQMDARHCDQMCFVKHLHLFSHSFCTFGWADIQTKPQQRVRFTQIVCTNYGTARVKCERNV